MFVKRKLFIAAGLFLCTHLCSGQELYIDNGVDTTDKKVAAAIQFYRQYLGEIRFDALPDFKKYWSAKDVAQNKIPDPVYYAITGFPTYLMSESRTLLYAKPAGDYVQLKTLFATPDSLKNISVTCITNHFIRFEESGKPCFINPIEIATRSWSKVQRRNVTFIHPPSHRFNAVRADSLITSIKKLERDWSMEPVSFRYYLTDTKDELYQLRGLDFVIGMGNSDVPSGRSDGENKIIYASGLGENNFHEVVHMYLNRRFPRSPLLEGLPTFYGGSLGRDLAWHIQYLDAYLQKHPERDLNKFRDFQYLDPFTVPNYTIEGLLCLLAYRKDGLAGLKRIMSYTSLEEVFQKEFNVPPGGWDAFLRTALHNEQKGSKTAAAPARTHQ